MSSRADRRRKRRSGFDDSSPPGRQLPFGRTTRIAFGFLIAGIVTVATVALIASSIGGGDSTETVANTGTATATPIGPTANATDQADIEALARKSIEVLPAGQWPSLYDDFTVDFRGRCDIATFTQGGVDSAISLGSNLQLLEFKQLKELSVTGDKASGVIVGGYRGTEGSDYDIQAAFAKEDGRWKIAPAPDTTGCSAFNQLGT